MELVKKIARYISILSIDVVLGAMAGLLFFSKLLRVEVGSEIFVLLGMAVWSIYTGDHLWDAGKANKLVSPRHQFHAKHKKALTILFSLVVLLGLVFSLKAFGLGKELYLSLILGAFILLTMILLNKAGNSAGFLKELSTSVFYVLGIAWFPLIQADPLELLGKPIFFLIFFVALALLNLLMLSVLDQNEDQTQGFSSAVGVFKLEKLIQGIQKMSFLLIFISLAGFIFLNSFYRPFACILLLMVLVHYLTFFNLNISSHTKRMRMESAFLMPWLLFVL